MQRARRLASLAGLALVGSLALTGCRSQPATAIYVGSTTYSQDYVDGLSEQLQKVSNFNRGDGRQAVAQWLVVRDLGKRLVADHNWPAPQVDEQGATEQIQQGLQPGDRAGIKALRPLIKVYAEFQAYKGVVQQHVTPVQLSDADYAELYQRYKAAGMLRPGVDEATFRKGLPPEEQQVIRPSLGLRDLYREAIRKSDLSVNPKYGLSELVLLPTRDGHPIVTVSLNSKAGESAVVPAPADPNQGLSNG